MFLGPHHWDGEAIQKSYRLKWLWSSEQGPSISVSPETTLRNLRAGFSKNKLAIFVPILLLIRDTGLNMWHA